ncbi:MAG: N-6 DNA methylase [Bacteroidia bacterium]|nr:N-6 DNA methylase [Bacteroidia bacterium]
MNDTFLTELGFTTENGLVHNLNEAQNNVERLYIEEVKKLSPQADAVFFRRFYKTETDAQPYSSIPTVCLFNQPDSFFNTEAHKALHAALWSAGKIDIYIILGKTRIDILNARRPAKRSGDDVSLEGPDLVLASEAIEGFNHANYSAHLFGSGTFWEQSEFQEKIDGNSNPYAFLLDYLMKARDLLIADKTLGLEAKTIDKLLITSILVKFLEEIKDDDGKHTLKEIYQKHKITSETFEEGLSKGACRGILKDLSAEFNGKIFDTFLEDELIKIDKANLSPIAKFLRSDIDIKTNQLFIWKQYSFKHLPAEVISAIYENFIQAEAGRNGEKKKDVVYTPLHLVNLLIDEVMPLDQPELFQHNRFKVLDPACGSGVFLVAAYKRMLQWWTINHWKKTGKLSYPNQAVSKQILEDNIFGVDIEEVAALVSIFSLTTAFLNKLTPKEIWNNLKFKDLGQKNIQGINFIDWATAAKEQQVEFDLVIGNPPFNPSSKGTINDKDLITLTGKKVPGNKLALKFFEAALFFGKRVCMIIPSNVFLYNKSTLSHNYRKEVFTSYTVEKIYDFTHLRRDLFHRSADTPVIALLTQKVPTKNQAIEHIVVNRQLLIEQKTRFEIDYYDKHQVRWDWAIDPEKHFVWKTNLLGGGRLFHLVYRLSLLDTLFDFINEKENWKEARGFEGGNKIIIENQDKIIGIQEDGVPIVEKNTSIQANNLKDAFIYEPPFMIIDQIIGDSSLSAAFISSQNKFTQNSHLYYNRDFIGISAPKADEVTLNEVFNQIAHKENSGYLNYQLYLMATSSSSLVLTETDVNKSEILTIPFPENKKFLRLSYPEEIIQNDVLKYYIHLGKAISKNNAGKILHDPISSEELEAFGETYCNALNDIYAENGKSWQPGQVLHTPTFVSYQFGFGKDGGLKHEMKTNSEQEFDSLFNDIKANSGAIHKRIIRGYNHVNGYDCVYFIKPLARRFWLQSIALRDADDTFMDLKKAGY